MKLEIDDSGNWKYIKIPRKVVPSLRDNLIRYINLLATIFNSAKKTSEFEFILTLLRIRGLSGPGWDSFETTEEVFKLISKLIDKSNNYITSRHLSLLLYAHIVEASELYEILASLIKICDGERFCVDNFPNKKRGKTYIPVYPSEKIDIIKKLANKVNLENSILPLVEIFNRDLRNAVFHSDYSLHNGELHLNKINKTIPNDNFIELINKCFAYFMAFSNLIKYHISSYKEPSVIKVHPDFSSDPNETVITLIRKGYGLIGLRDYESTPNIQDEYVPYLIGRFNESELKLNEKYPRLTVYPRDKRETINNILKIFPVFLRKKIVKFLKPKI
jgi:hypothetical protein